LELKFEWLIAHLIFDQVLGKLNYKVRPATS
jgi:hypothetical protein